MSVHDGRTGSTHTLHAAMTPEGGRAFKVDGRWAGRQAGAMGGALLQ